VHVLNIDLRIRQVFFKRPTCDWCEVAREEEQSAACRQKKKNEERRERAEDAFGKLERLFQNGIRRSAAALLSAIARDFLEEFDDAVIHAQVHDFPFVFRAVEIEAPAQWQVFI